MTPKPPTNRPASVHQRLLNLSVECHEDFNRLVRR
jgi:hypothetical protein